MDRVSGTTLAFYATAVAGASWDGAGTHSGGRVTANPMLVYGCAYNRESGETGGHRVYRDGALALQRFLPKGKAIVGYVWVAGSQPLRRPLNFPLLHSDKGLPALFPRKTPHKQLAASSNGWSLHWEYKS
jgi:hypothetical protein